jgi:Ran GTPase-activating protein (RanGAP) involved in mRNA processing and transport
LVCLHAGINEFGDEGIPILLEPFSACRNVLEDLKLDQNEIEGEGTKALISASFPKLKSLNLEENDDMVKKQVIAKYGDIVNFGDEDEGDMDAEEADEDIDTLIQQMAGASLKA